MLESIAQAITGFLGRNNNPLGLLVLGATALIEYVFPPFPGDTITLFSAVLVTRYRWNLGLVFASVLAGSAVGAMIDYYVGVFLGARYREGRFLRAPAVRQKVDVVIAAFRRHGEAYVALNRFLPAVRAVFFLAAGMAALRPLRVLFFALLSAAAWNALILGVGWGLGANWERIRSIFTTYSEVAWAALGLVVVILVGHRLWLRRRKRV
jgi:membrane protein DedA with SNARE-associated domain